MKSVENDKANVELIVWLVGLENSVQKKYLYSTKSRAIDLVQKFSLYR